MSTAKRWTGPILAIAMVAVGGATIRYRSDLRAAHARVDRGSLLAPSACGNIEYAQGGAGPVVLIVHGAGGGFDQGALIARILLSDGFRWIAPSRFGYLRSTACDGATIEDQAHAYANLLDRLGVDRVAVVALSAGGSSATLFAALYPERVSSLTLLSAGVTPLDTDAQAASHRKGTWLARIFQRDLAYWGATTFFRRQALALMGVDGTVVAGFTPEQRELADRMIDEMLPVSRRSAGAMFDNRNAAPGARIVGVRAPTLIVHAVDDGLQLFGQAEFAVANIPDARLLRFEKGGHFVAITERDTVRKAVQAHIREHAKGAVPADARPAAAVGN